MQAHSEFGYLNQNPTFVIPVLAKLDPKLGNDVMNRSTLESLESKENTGSIALEVHGLVQGQGLISILT